jgi:hypothetical protein
MPREERFAMGRAARTLVDTRLTKRKLCNEFCDIVESGLPST